MTVETELFLDTRQPVPRLCSPLEALYVLVFFLVLVYLLTSVLVRMESIAGKTALIVGGTGGIGAALSQKLAFCGVNLIVHGATDSSDFALLAEKLAERVRVKKIVQRLECGFGKAFGKTELGKALVCCDIVCVCFGPFIQKTLADTSNEDWQTVSELNYVLPGILVSRALPAMVERRWGRFLLMGGTRTERVNSFRTNAAYAGAKTALSSLVRSTATSYASFGITCNALFPGFTHTEYLASTALTELAAKMPQKRLVKPAEIAQTGVFLLRQPMINGALVSIDGGWQPFL